MLFLLRLWQSVKEFTEKGKWGRHTDKEREREKGRKEERGMGEEEMGGTQGGKRDDRPIPSNMLLSSISIDAKNNNRFMYLFDMFYVCSHNA